MTTPNSSSAVTPAASGKSEGTTQAAAAATSPNADIMTTTVSNIGDLQSKAPQVWHAMLLGIAISMCGQMQRKQEEIDKIIRESQQQSS